MQQSSAITQGNDKMVKLSIATGGGACNPRNYCFSLESIFEEEQKMLLGLVMLPEKPRISYLSPSIPCISLDDLPYFPNDEELPSLRF